MIFWVALGTVRPQENQVVVQVDNIGTLPHMLKLVTAFVLQLPSPTFCLQVFRSMSANEEQKTRLDTAWWRVF